MDSDNLKLIAHETPWNAATEFALISEYKDKRFVAEPLVMREFKLGEQMGPTFRLSYDRAQELFNSLWRIGYRPKDGTGNSGHVAAIEYHLEDMRKLVFKS